MKLLARTAWLIALVLCAFVLYTVRSYAAAPPAQNPQSGAVGLQGKISTKPPKTGATISVPGNGQSFSSTPITVAGICPAGLLVKIFRNNIFAGSADCKNGSFSLQIDLFSGKNEIVARVYDSLDQKGPDSNKVTVSFNDSQQGAAGEQLVLTSDFAKRGAAPGQTLTWPLALSGGIGPYAISVDWGDGTDPDLISQPFAGNFTIQHIYQKAGIYTIIIKVSDKNGQTAFLQLVGVGTGKAAQSQENGSDQTGGIKTITKIIWQPVALFVPLFLVVFWLGKRYETTRIKKRIDNGDPPFGS